MTGIELVVTDLDGTLWEQPDTTPQVTRNAVDELGRRGIPLLVATGRRLGSTQRPLAAIDLAPPAVLLNGGLGVDLASGERFHLGGFEADAAQRLLEIFSAEGLQPCLYVDDDTAPVRVGDAPSTHPDHMRSFGAEVGTDDLARVATEERVLAFSVLGIERTIADRLGQLLAGDGVPHVSADRTYGDYGVTVAPMGDSKWDGIEAFCLAESIDSERVLVIGDGPNDVEMLAEAAIAVVPSDGHPTALELADHVCARADDGGWAELLDLL